MPASAVAELDAALAIEGLVLERNPILRRRARQIILRQVRPIIRRGRIRAHADDELRVGLVDGSPGQQRDAR